MVGPSSPRSRAMPSGSGCGPGLSTAAATTTTTTTGTAGASSAAGRRRTSTRIVGRGSHHSPTPGAPVRSGGSISKEASSTRQGCHDADLLEYLRRQRVGPPLLSRRVMPIPSQARTAGVTSSSSSQAPRNPQNVGSGTASGSASAAASPRTQVAAKAASAAPPLAVVVPAPVPAPTTVFPAPPAKDPSSMTSPSGSPSTGGGAAAAEIAAAAAAIAAERVDPTKMASGLSSGTSGVFPGTHPSAQAGSWGPASASDAADQMAVSAVESGSVPGRFPMAPAPTAKSQALLSPTSQGMLGSHSSPVTTDRRYLDGRSPADGEAMAIGKSDAATDASPHAASARTASPSQHFQQQQSPENSQNAFGDASLDKVDASRSTGGGSGCVPGVAGATASGAGRRRGVNRTIARSPNHSPAPGVPARPGAAVPKNATTEAASAAGRQTCHSAKIQRRQWLGPPVLSSRRITPSTAASHSSQQQVRSPGAGSVAGLAAPQHSRHPAGSGGSAIISPRSQAAAKSLAPSATAFSTPPSKETVAMSSASMGSPAGSPSTGGGGNAAAEIAAVAAAIAAGRADSTKIAASPTPPNSNSVQGANASPAKQPFASVESTHSSPEKSAPETCPASPLDIDDPNAGGSDVCIAPEETSTKPIAAREADSPSRFPVTVSVPDDTEDDDNDEAAACAAVSESVVGYFPMAPAPTARSQALLSPTNHGGSVTSGLSPGGSPQATPLGDKSRSLNMRSFLNNSEGPSDGNLHEHEHEHEHDSSNANPNDNGNSRGKSDAAVDGSPVASSVRTASPNQQLQHQPPQHSSQSSRLAFGDMDNDKASSSSHVPCETNLDAAGRLEGSGGGATGASTAATSGDDDRYLASGLGGAVIWAGLANEANQRSGLAAAAAAAVASQHLEGSTAPGHSSAPASTTCSFPTAIGAPESTPDATVSAFSAAEVAAAAAAADTANDSNADIGAGVASALGLPDLSGAPDKVLLLSSLVDNLVKHAASCEKKLAAEQRANLSLRVSVWTLERQNSQLQQQLNSVSQSFQQLVGGAQGVVDNAEVHGAYTLAAPVDVSQIQTTVAQ